MERLRYDEELNLYIRDMDEVPRAELFTREAAPPLEGRVFDTLTEEEFLTYLHVRTSRYLQELYPGHMETASGIVLQCLVDLSRRKRHPGPDLADADRYDLGGLEQPRGRGSKQTCGAASLLP